jgi:soluble lytic murein transglycosylase-like protein
MRRRKSLTLLAFVLFLVVAGALAALVYGRQRLLPAVATAPASEPAAPPASAAEAYAAAAEAFREGDETAGRRALAALAAAQPRERERALLVLGLHHYASGQYEAAEEILQVVGDPSGELEDWRLYALADSAARIGDDALAEAAIARLLEQPHASPLRGRALVGAAERAWERDDTELALSRISLARSQRLTPLHATEIDVLAWRIGVDLGDRAVERAAAKRLLVHSPAKASELDAGDIFLDENGRITTWDGVLTQEEIEQRAASWLAADRPQAAVNTLATVSGHRRGLAWHLLQAQALTDQGKGAEAYALLRGLEAGSDGDQARLEWQRARAAADVAVARSGRDNRSGAERERMLAVSQQHLRRVVELNVDTATSVSAVRKLYAHLVEEGRFDEAMEMLQLLRHLDPEDRTGAGYLWERGWQEYQRRNFSTAVGYWTQLEQIYPGDRDTHRGSYWKGRALEEIGESRRARAVYREVVRGSDTADFYVRQAQERLEGDEEHGREPGSLSPPWPEDPSLRRVLVLSNFGLEQLAELELEALADAGEARHHERDVQALRGILTVRAGNPRKGVQLLKAAFPDLGGPFQAGVPPAVLGAYYPLNYQQAIARAAEHEGLPPALVAGIIRQESAFDRKAQSWAGARGLMQIMPATAKEWAGRLDLSHSPERLFDPEYSIRLGSAYFRYVLRRFDGNVELALAGYNGGPNRIRRLWQEAGGDAEGELDLFLEQLDISESQAYVKRILVLSDSYRQLYPAYRGDGRQSG